MVRAATTGAFNYTGADPTNKQWRLRHRLVILGLMDRDDKEMLQTLHHHWLGYVAHGNLTSESFDKVKSFSNDILKDIKAATYPWIAAEDQQKQPEESKPQNATISAEDAGLIARYKAMQAQFKSETTGQ